MACRRRSCTLCVRDAPTGWLSDSTSLPPTTDYQQMLSDSDVEVISVVTM